MISPEEEKFYLQWEKERTLPHYKRKPFLIGLSFGLWIMIAIVLFSFGFAWLYQQFTSEMNEQRFNELKHLKNKK
ncbi:MAG: hypothetical protein LW603_02305 [Sediminibacterium sp.]|nr:hypothetical protein [Sediminibacterium sp.]